MEFAWALALMFGLFRPKFEPPFAPYLMFEEETVLPAATWAELFAVYCE